MLKFYDQFIGGWTNQQPTTDVSSLTKINQSGQKVDIEDVTNINSKVSDLSFKKSGLESQLKSPSSRKAKLIAGISISALTTTATAAAIAITAALSISISVALPVLFGISVTALTVFIFCLKNTYKEINKHPLEKNSLKLESKKLEFKKKDLKKKFPCISNFLKIESNFITPNTIKARSKFKNKEDIDYTKYIIFRFFLSEIYDKNRNLEKEVSNIKKEEQENYISYKHIIDGAKDKSNDGICMEVKFHYDGKNLDTNQSAFNIDNMDISLSKGETTIAKITRDFIKTQPKTNN